MSVAAYGITRVETSVHLLKLFGPSAKILGDYRWMEDNLGKLVPMEILISVDKHSQREIWEPKVETTIASDDATETQPESAEDETGAAAESVVAKTKPPVGLEPETDPFKLALKYRMLDRIEMSHRIQSALEHFFGLSLIHI